MRLLLFTLWFLFIYGIFAQQVTTIIAPETGIGYEAVNWNHINNRILIPDWINGFVHEIDADGNRTIILDSIAGPLGGAFDLAGNFYVSEYGTGDIIRIAPDGTDQVVGQGFGGPAGMLVDSAQQILYVADYDHNVIRRLYLNDFSMDTLVFNQGLNGPDCIVYAPNGDLIINNFNDNKIFRITTEGELSIFSILNGSLNSGYLVRRGDEYIVCGFYSNRIWLVDAEGNASIWAGSTAGGMDGPLAEATFNRPNGIAMSPDGDTLIVSDGVGANARVRMITGLNEAPNQSIDQGIAKGLQLTVFPNPASEKISFSYELPQAVTASLTIYDLEGRVVQTIIEQQRIAAGEQQHNWVIPDSLANGYYQSVLQLNEGLVTRAFMVKRK